MYFDFVGNMLKLNSFSSFLFLSPSLSLSLSPSIGFVKLNLQMVGVFLIVILIRYWGATFEVFQMLHFICFAVLTPHNVYYDIIRT